ncbi:hypothetical protein RRG08_060651 [Elysia crispata]|uniref:Uncharacterized protein n=1 Tax=Elysia crispata TaxID=231223 RepID=A0AAE1AT90_9GAST|nr:hypothetical protein RRG08_060651 [Elysia crispata]
MPGLTLTRTSGLGCTTRCSAHAGPALQGCTSRPAVGHTHTRTHAHTRTHSRTYAHTLQSKQVAKETVVIRKTSILVHCCQAAVLIRGYDRDDYIDFFMVKMKEACQV